MESEEYTQAKSQRRRKFENNARARQAKPYLEHRRSGAFSDNPTHSKNRNIYEDTQRIFRSLRTNPPESRLFDIGDSVPVISQTVRVDPIIEVANDDTLDMAQRYVSAGLRPLVLNMASEFKAGGGVASGKTAQEECIFRRSNAFMTHPRKWYPLEPAQVILSPQITVIKDSNYTEMPRKDWFNVGLITVPALRKPRLSDDGTDYDREDDRLLMQAKIEAVFRIAADYGYDSLVLGALGCGVFQNPPEQVARLFRAAIEQFGGRFKQIGFAVLVVKDTDTDNLNTFKRVLTI